jgi:hypothetical protein
MLKNRRRPRIPQVDSKKPPVDRLPLFPIILPASKASDLLETPWASLENI